MRYYKVEEWEEIRKSTPYVYRNITKKMRNQAQQWTKTQMLEAFDNLIEDIKNLNNLNEDKTCMNFGECHGGSCHGCKHLSY